MSEPLQVTFLWHMHQPCYRDPLAGEYDLPWTYLHAVKDYYDMAAIVEETDGARVVFNLVPSLLEQILDYAAGTAVDPFLLHAGRDPAAMTAENRRFVLDNFFSANRERMIEPYPRYLELLYLAGNGWREASDDRIRRFGDQEILDLQVWFYLAWTGEAARRRRPELRELLAKGRNFTPEDKRLLFHTHGELLREIIPLYRRLHEQGKAELSVSPYYHPILPLLCDMGSARVAMPRASLPGVRFRHPEDARAQVTLAMDYFSGVFGFAPAGMWPSEGAVSDEALSVMAGCGIRWAASDEGVLAASLSTGLGEGKRRLYRPYVFGGDGDKIALLFRDRHLSDLIGFSYSRWEAEKAAEDLIGRLVDIGKRFPGALVTVILDGENAWEHYPENGFAFLTGLYRRIAARPGLDLTLPSEALGRFRDPPLLSHVHPGSWINANYGIWVGHPEENVAWEQLERAREAAVTGSDQVAALLSASGVANSGIGGEDATAGLVLRRLYAAEGSDWFWWYGDDHFSPHSHHFDRLFRNNLIAIYRLLDMEVPRELFEPIKRITPAGLVREPATLITPRINGMVDDYFEWLGAGLYDLSRQSSAMHASESLLLCFFYGYDGHSFYFRVDSASPLEKMLRRGDVLRLHLLLEREFLLVMYAGSTEGEILVKDQAAWIGAGTRFQWRIGPVCEARVPLSAICPEKGRPLFAYLTLTRGDEEIGRWPTHAPMALTYRGPELELENWLV